MTRKGGKQVRAPIGDYPEIGLGDARELANRILDAKVLVDSNGVAPTNDEIFPLLETLCNDYVEQMKVKGQEAHDALSSRACSQRDQLLQLHGE